MRLWPPQRIPMTTAEFGKHRKQGSRSLPFSMVQEWEMIYHVPARDREQKDLKMLAAGMKAELQ